VAFTDNDLFCPKGLLAKRDPVVAVQTMSSASEGLQRLTEDAHPMICASRLQANKNIALYSVSSVQS
jgi:hypothetical protein